MGRRVVLVGPMAVGKSAVGRLVAQLSGSAFVDSDRVIVERHGRISDIFATSGEPEFRRLEVGVVREALEREDVVVSLGGGAVLHPDTQELLRRVEVVFLDTDLASVRPRITGETGRPLLADRPEDRWQQLYDERRPVYEALATIVLDTRGRSVRTCATAVLAALEETAAPVPAPGTPDQHPIDESVTEP
jgi:shikimate kinase